MQTRLYQKPPKLVSPVTAHIMLCHNVDKGILLENLSRLENPCKSSSLSRIIEEMTSIASHFSKNFPFSYPKQKWKINLKCCFDLCLYACLSDLLLFKNMTRVHQRNVPHLLSPIHTLSQVSSSAALSHSMGFQLLSSKNTKHSHMSLCMRKPTIWVSDQVRHKPGCTVTEAG